MSGDGLRAEFDRDSGDHCGDGDGPVGDGGSLQQRRDGRVHVLGPVEVVCPAELRPVRVPTIFHHSGTARYFFFYTSIVSLLKVQYVRICYVN